MGFKRLGRSVMVERRVMFWCDQCLGLEFSESGAMRPLTRHGALA